MISFNLLELAQVSQGILVGKNIKISKISIDTRKHIQGSLFITLKGKKFNSFNFIQEAIKKGVIALLTDQYITTNLPYIVVKNTKLALGQLSLLIRKKSKVIAIAITGSSGKTTVKEMTSNILKTCGNTLYTYKNLNNNIGVPLTLINLHQKHKYLVVEIGANNPGEIEYSTNLVQPKSALVNNITAAHLLGFKSIQGIANAKGEIFNGLKKNGTAIINYDSNDVINWKSKLNNKKILYFSKNKTLISDIYASNIFLNQKNTIFNLHYLSKKIKIQINLLGIHNVYNALAASALAISIGIPLKKIQTGLFYTKNILGRLFPIQLNKNQLIIDDSYNANYSSVIAAIKVLSNMSGYLVIVIGDIAELGLKTNFYYQKIGQFLNFTKINKVISFGNLSKKISDMNISGEHFYKTNLLVNKLLLLIKKHSKITILIKGSRNMSMDQIVNILKEKNNVNIIK